MYHRQSLLPVCVEKMPCPYGPSKPNSVNVRHRISALFIREKKEIVNLLVHCSVSILLSLKAEGWVEYGRYCKDR